MSYTLSLSIYENFSPTSFLSKMKEVNLGQNEQALISMAASSSLMPLLRRRIPTNSVMNYSL